MMISEKAKQHVDSCRFCWMCHHICPIGNATGHERSTPRARALGISLVNRGAIELCEIRDNIYECAGCGACVHDCTTGWDPVMFTGEVRLQAALEDALPAYINKMVDNCLETGNAYGKTAMCETLTAAIAAHSAPTDTLLYLGVDARYMACKQALKAIRVLEKAVETMRGSDHADVVIEVHGNGDIHRVRVDSSIRNTVTALLEIKLSDSKRAFESLKIIQEAQP